MTKNKIFRIAIITSVVGLVIYYFYPEQKLYTSKTIDLIVVYKSKRKLLVFSDGKLLKTYSISLGKNPVGHKQFEGDYKTPEGLYTINDKNPNSGYFMNLGVSYPNNLDLEIAKKAGKLAGGAIKIHGIRNRFGYIGKFQRWKDWTAGCIAVTNYEMKELYSNVKIGTQINILP